MNQSGIVDQAGGLRSDVVTFGQLFAALYARMRLILGVTAFGFVAALVFVMVATPRFASETQVLLESREAGYTRTLSEREIPGGVFDDQAVASQVQVISSRDVAREAIRRLGLVGNPEFDPLAGPTSPVARVRMMLGASGGLYDGPEEDRIFDSYYANLTVFPVAGSRVIAIRFTSEDPDLAARAANVIAQVYLDQLEEAKADLARAASSWLGTSIEELRARVSTAEEAVERFRAQSGLFMGGNNATITSQQLSDINTELAQARSARADSQARAQLIRDMIAGGRSVEIPDVANNELIQRLIEQRIAMRSQLALEQQTFLPAHPRIRELRAQINDLDAQINAAAQQTVRVLENDARLAGARVESLEAALEAQMRVVAQANENEVRLRAFEREARAEREQLEAYLTRYREAVARGTGNASLPDARIVSRAVVAQTPVFPRKVPTVVLASLMALFLAGGAVVVAELAFGSAHPAIQAPARQVSRQEDGDLPPPGGRAARSSFFRDRARGSWIARLAQRSKSREVAATLEPDPAPDPEGLQLRGTFDDNLPERAADATSSTALSLNEFPMPDESAVETAASVSPEPELGAVADAAEIVETETYAYADESRLDDLPEPTGRAIDPVEAAEEDEARAFASAHSLEPRSHEVPDQSGNQMKAADMIAEPFAGDEAAMTEAAPESLAGAVTGAKMDAVADEQVREPEADEEGTDAAVVASTAVHDAVEEAAVSQPEQSEKPVAENLPAEKPATRKKASTVAGGEGDGEERFHFERLVERISQIPVEGRGRRVLMTGLGDPDRLATLAREFSRELARTSNAISVETQSTGDSEPSIGLTDLIADDASFFHAIRQDAGSRLHYVSVGTADPALLLREPDALEISFCAFDQTYEWVVLSLPDVQNAELYALLAKSADSVVLATDEEPGSATVLALYEAARKAGAPQVLVACVGDIAKAAAA